MDLLGKTIFKNVLGTRFIVPLMAQLTKGHYHLLYISKLFFFGSTAPRGPWPPHSQGF
jgi:hypothetical protein